MSKAFTKESDDERESWAPPPPPALPPGTKNYMTSAGASRLREQWAKLAESRKALSTENPHPETRSAIERIDRQILGIQTILQRVDVVGPPGLEDDRVRFGARVDIEHGSGERESFQIVGVEEVDCDAGRISWLSPFARALLNKRVGDSAQVKRPDGTMTLRILSIDYSGREDRSTP